MAGSSLSTHLRACARATIQAVGGETISYRPVGIHANKRDMIALVERTASDPHERGRREVWTVHVEDHPTRGITDPNKLDEIEADEIEGDSTTRVVLKYSKTVLDEGTGIIVLEFRR